MKYKQNRIIKNAIDNIPIFNFIATRTLYINTAETTTNRLIMPDREADSTTVETIRRHPAIDSQRCHACFFKTK
jgi:hypothetical protein